MARENRGLVCAALVALLVAASTLHVSAGDPPVEDRAAFDAGMEKAHGLLGREKCRRGLVLVTELLSEHEGRPYVLARRGEIEDLVRRLAFGKAHPTPDPKAVVSGKLIRYVRGSGKIRIRYTPKTEGDLESLQGEVLAFPARMKGPFKVTLEGNPLPTEIEHSPRLIVGNEDDPKTGRTQTWTLVAGSPDRVVGDYIHSLYAALVHQDGETSKDLVSTNPPVAFGKPYKLKFDVHDRKLTGFVNGRKFGPEQKPPGVFGVVAFDARNWTSITIDGAVEPAWIQGLIDEVVQKNLAAFRETYDQTAYLPAWLLAEPDPKDETPRTATPYWPANVDPRHHAALDDLEEALRRGSPEGIALAVAKMGSKAVPRPVVRYLQALADLRLYRLQSALEQVEACLEDEPTFLAAELLRGQVLGRMGRDDEALDAFAKAEVGHPRAPAVYEHTVLHLLLVGKPEDARRVYERSVSRRVGSEGLDGLGRALIKASTGPAWTRVHDCRSAHYHVFSDIDKDTCRKASRTLEEAYAVYQGTLKRVARDGLRFRVYLFRGRDGFATYLADLGTLGAEVHMNVAGVYSPLLKQLLIWNLPNREMMLRTVRHEGLHQYLDRFLPNIPTWFNEGLAEYYEHAHHVVGRIYFGRPQREYVELLRRQRPMPTARFLTLSADAFYEGGIRNYAQAWALMHMLRHGGPHWRKLFKQLLSDLETLPTHEALERAFGDLDPQKLDEAFKAHLESLSE